MKKRVLPFLPFIFAAALLLGIAVFSTPLGPIEEWVFVVGTGEPISLIREEEYWNNLERANDVASPVGAMRYPDFIGGVYYNADGDLVVQIVDAHTTKDSMRHAQALFGELLEWREGSILIVEYVEFSYNELYAAMDFLNAFFLANPGSPLVENVPAFALDTMNNRVVVELLVYTEEKIALFRETILDSPVITFRESAGPAVLLF